MLFSAITPNSRFFVLPRPFLEFRVHGALRPEAFGPWGCDIDIVGLQVGADLGRHWELPTRTWFRDSLNAERVGI